MFKHLKRNLKLGLTTLTILTAGAGAAFATTPIDIVNYCDGQNYRDRVNCSSAIRSCIRNPFGDGCDTTLVGNAYTVAKVRYCSDQTVTEGHACTETWARPNAASLVKSFITDDTPDGLASAPTPPRKSQFLKGTVDFLDTGDIDVHEDGALYFDTATYKGVLLGGDATDGVAFFYDQIGTSHRSRRYYVGILSGTDLGAPLAQTMKVNWVGQFQVVGAREKNTDFILEIDFDGGARTGTIGAFVPYRTGYNNIHLTGTFDSKGVITGDAVYSGFRNRDRAKIAYSLKRSRKIGKLTGLIGAEGAVGVLHSIELRGYVNSYYGGFIARPSTQDEINGFTAICVSDPFDPVCEVRYKEERKAIINACIIGGNANPTDCNVRALAKHPCIANPFTGICMTDFSDYYQTARTNRLAFCDNTANVENPVCIGEFRTDICDYDPFNAVCSFEGNPYDSDRASRLIDQCRDDTTGNAPCTTKFRDCTIDPFGTGCDTALGGYHDAMQIKFCGLHSNKITETNRTCEAILKRVTVASWLQSFATERTTDIQGDGHVKASATRLDNGVLTTYRSISLNLADATFGGAKIGGDAADGVAFFDGWNGNRWSRNAGILSGTDLGAPLTQTSGTAHWNGWFQSLGTWPVSKDFVLDINFNDKTIPGSVAGIEAFVQQNSGDYYYHLKGSFDGKGVIKGTAVWGNFINGDRNGTTGYRSSLAVLKGLIGEEGAVGVFYNYYSAGGFVASPNVGRVNYWQWLNRFDDTLPLKPVITLVTTSDGNSVSTLENQFLQGTADGLEFGNIKKSTRGRGTDPDITILDLQVAEYDGSILGGDDTNAVAFFKGRLNDSENYYYAGLLPDTNLGAPVTQTQGTATWTGEIGTLNHDVNGDFELKIYFAEEKVEGFTPIQGTNANHKYLYLRGKFDDYGVISGHTRYGEFANGTRPAINATVAFNGQLRGLIGQEGAVGVFISDNRSDGNNADGYSGGFVVENPDN